MRQRRNDGTLVRHAMTEAPTTARSDLNAADAAGMMRSHDVGVIPIAEDGKLIGLVTHRELVMRVLDEIGIALHGAHARRSGSGTPERTRTSD